MRLPGSLMTGSIRWGVALSTLAAATTLSALPMGSVASATQPEGPDLAPLLGTERETAIEGQYNVVLDHAASTREVADAQETAVEAGGDVEQSFDTALSGFTAELPDAAVEELRANPDVAFIEADQRVRASGLQKRAPWGLDRIDQRSRQRNGRYRYTHTGAGVTAYVIDTGLRTRHRQFRGRVAGGFSAIKDGRGTNDCNGHGTHVAGILGGKRYGVAKRVTIRPVRVLRCGGGGSNSGVIAGIDWVTSHHKNGPAVANISLGGQPSRAMDAAVQRAVADGITVVVAAGNEGWDACSYSPGRTPVAITVGATRRNDVRSSFSNWGTCVDVFAPGSAILSSWYKSNRSKRIVSGTSMAAPHVSGAAALYLQGHRRARPEQVKAVILDQATNGKVGQRRAGSPNRLLYSRLKGSPPNNVLLNPSFESGTASGWTASPGVITRDPGEGAYSGAWKAWLGGTGTAHTDELEQRVNIPGQVRRALLSLYLRSRTNDPADRRRDVLTIEVDAAGQTWTVGTIDNTVSGLGMVRRTYNLSRYAGGWVTIRFEGTEDDIGLTNFVIDQVGLSTNT